MSGTKQRTPTIRAGEIGEYVYCARSWWLRRVIGLEPEHCERLERGTALHHRHGQAVAGSRLLLGAAIVLAVVGFILLLVSR